MIHRSHALKTQRPRPITFVKKFYQRNVDLGLDAECHECTSHCKSKLGYPLIGRNGKTWTLHRWLWWQETGELPEVVMHKCDNPSCINLAHLQAATYSENSKDCSKKGRLRGSCSLSSEQVLDMRIKRSNGMKLKDLAEEFHMTPDNVSKITTGQSYKNFSGPITKRKYTSKEK